MIRRKTALENVQNELGHVGLSLQGKQETPNQTEYRPELDSSPELIPRQISFYQGLVGQLRWICELGRLDIVMPTCLLVSYLMTPRKGRLDQALRVFSYLLSDS